MRMIDGELAFPDEGVGPGSARCRVHPGAASEDGDAAPRRPDGVTLVTWGNADAGLRQMWNALTWGAGPSQRRHGADGGRRVIRRLEFARIAGVAGELAARRGLTALRSDST